MIVRTAMLTLCLSVVPLGGASAQSPAPPTTAGRVELTAALQRALDQVCREQKCPGATAAIALPDGSVIEAGTGFADVESKIAMKPDSRMFGGSIGKTQVAIVALALAGEGRIDLDAPITRYLGSEKWLARIDGAEKITTRQLLQHRSGIVNYWDNGAFYRYAANINFANMDTALARRTVLDFASGQPLLFAPGSGYRYSDSGYFVVGRIIETVTGRKLEDEIADRIVKPLDLNATKASTRKIQKDQAMGYVGEYNPLAAEGRVTKRNGSFTFNPEIEWAGGGYVTTSGDLARLFKGLFEGKLLPPTQLAQMIARPDGTTDSEAAAPRGFYGLGIHVVRDYQGLGTAYFHSGYMPGAQSMAFYIPRARVAVAYQTNSEAGLWATAMKRPLKGPVSDPHAAMGALVAALSSLLPSKP